MRLAGAPNGIDGATCCSKASMSHAREMSVRNGPGMITLARTDGA